MCLSLKYSRLPQSIWVLKSFDIRLSSVYHEFAVIGVAHLSLSSKLSSPIVSPHVPSLLPTVLCETDDAFLKYTEVTEIVHTIQKANTSIWSARPERLKWCLLGMIQVILCCISNLKSKIWTIFEIGCKKWSPTLAYKPQPVECYSCKDT